MVSDIETIHVNLNLINSRMKEMRKYMKQSLDAFKIVGIFVETTNEGMKGLKDIEKLWKKFYNDKISSLIKNKHSEEVYAVYTDYQSNYKGKYTAIVGHCVESVDNIPDGLVAREFSGGQYMKVIAKGNLPGSVLKAWQEIWHQDETLNRKYTADLEVYGEKSQQGDESEVDIYIAVS